MVKRWNGEIDTLLVYVRVDTDRRVSYTNRLRCCSGGFILRSTDGIQRPVVPSSPARQWRHNRAGTRPHIFSAVELLRQLSLRELVASGFRPAYQCI